ncbi:MAG: 50S ribosomal protein L25 [Candidatus Villigracilaceae bacterium]
MEKVVFQATKRSVVGKQVRALRRQGKLPGVLYGHNVEPIPLQMDAHDASLILPRLTASSLVTVMVDGKEYTALVREKQRNFIKNQYLHVDFQAVSLTEKIRTKVNIELTGVSPAVKNYNAVLVSGLDELEVECLPQDLPERIVVDISTLENMGDGIYVRDIVLSDKVKVWNDPEEMVVVVTAVEEETITAEASVEIEPELSVERGKKEKEEEKK